MEAIVLAGGFGTRLRSVVPELPKPMASVAGRPFLEILLGNLARMGFQRVVLALGYKSEIIISHFGEEFRGLQLSYFVETSPLGTGGAAASAVERCSGDHAFILNGDTFVDFDASAVESAWQRRRNPIVVACAVRDSSRYGRLLIDSGRVVGFSEKGEIGPGLINAGVYVIDSLSLKARQHDGAFSLERDLLEPMVSSRQVDVLVSEGVFIDIGVPEDYFRAQSLLADRV
jgi:D-glycero-alpha-D-manno-heptose 1-phosphate guanylyltransferase